MNHSTQLLSFTLDARLYALRLAAVERIVRAVELTPLPRAPELIPGLINVQGRIIPVINTRRRFGLPEQDLELSDRFILANTARRTVALVVDAVIGVVDPLEQNMVHPEKITPGLEYIEGVVKLESGLLLIYKLERFLSPEEEAALDRAVEKLKVESQ